MGVGVGVAPGAVISIVIVEEVVAGQVDDAQHDDVRASVFEDVGYLGIAVGKFPVPEVPEPVRRIAAGRRPVKRHRERRLTGRSLAVNARDRSPAGEFNATNREVFDLLGGRRVEFERLAAEDEPEDRGDQLELTR